MKKILKRVIVACLTSIVMLTTVNAQTDSTKFSCGNGSNIFDYLQANGLLDSLQKFNDSINSRIANGNYTQSTSYVIPVVFHIVNSGTTTGVTYAQVQWQLAALNAAFANQSVAFTGAAPGTYAVNTNIQFKLACNAVYGDGSSGAWTNSTQPGMMTYYNVSATNALNVPSLSSTSTNADYSPLLSITNPTVTPHGEFLPPSKYLNIYCVPNIIPSGVIGFSTFPTAWFSMPSLNLDGIILRQDVIGNNSYPTNFPLISQLNLGLVLPHEVGHYLGLWHTFQPWINGSPTSYNLGLNCYGDQTTTCNVDGDQIADTPPTKINYDLGGILYMNSCGENYGPYNGYGNSMPDVGDQLENYMCYSYDSKRTTFTQGQANRIVTIITSASNPRYNLWQAANLTLTGAGGCGSLTGIVNGIFNYAIVQGSSCGNVLIQFTNPTTSDFNSPSMTTYSWTFGDGGNASIANPSHLYTTVGNYIVSCTATNGTVTNTYTTTVSTNFNVHIVGQNGTSISTGSATATSNTVCRGSEQTLYVWFDFGVPSVTITDGTNNYVVQNYMDLSKTEIIPYTFTVNGTSSYSISPASCNGVSNGVATFNVVDCCSNMITNGDFEAGNTGFATDALNSTSATGSGRYAVDFMANTTGQFAGGAPHIVATGKVYCIDGFSGNNTIVTVPSYTCGDLTDAPRLWQQTINGLQPSTQYCFSYKISGNSSANFTCPVGLNTGLNIQSSIKSSTATALANQDYSPTLLNQISTGATGINWGYEVVSYNFTTSGTTSPTDTYSITLSQILNFNGGGYDYTFDNVVLKSMNPVIQAVGNATLSTCTATTTPLSATVNCGASLSNYNFTWSPASSVACYTCASTTASPTTTTIYTLVATPTVNTTPPLPNSISTITVTINPTAMPTLSVSPTATTICAGQCVTFTATSSSSTYTWSTGANTSTMTACPIVNSTYTVSSKSTTTGCANTQTVGITVNPSISIAPTSATICAGQSTVLSATGANSYTWSTGANTSNITVAPTITTTYSVSGTNTLTACAVTRTVSVTVNPLPTITTTVVPNPACQNQPVTITASGASTYTWSNGATGSIIIGSFPNTGVKTITVTGISASGCSSAPLTTTLMVNPTPTLTAVSSPTAICVNQSATLTASPIGGSYTWTPSSSLNSPTGITVIASPTITTIYTVSTIKPGFTCVGTNTVTVVVNSCTVCATCTASIAGTVTANPTQNQSYCINSNITISGNVAFTNSEFRIAPNVIITIAPSSTLTIYNSHLYSCSGMWQGIVGLGNSVLKSKYGLIEDAKVAITTTATAHSAMATIHVENSTFNKNNVSLQVVSSNTITPPTGTTYSIEVWGCIFTSRTINTSGSSIPNWPAFATIASYSTMPSPLQAPYLNQYSVTTCKDGTYPSMAIQLTNVGVTTSAPSSPSYNEVFIGGPTVDYGVNIFDNHYYGVQAYDANVTVVNSIFQNSQFTPAHTRGVFPHITFFPPFGGTGVYAYSTDNSIDNYRVQLVPQTGTSRSNSFYDVMIGLYMYHYLEANVTYNNTYSTAQSYTTGADPTPYKGKTGFQLYTNRYKNLTVDHNNLYNISNPIIFTADVGDYYNGSSLVTGRYGGQVTITNNFIRPHINNTYSITNQYVQLGIDAEDVLGLTSGYTNATVTGTNINISSNTIDKVWNGIYTSNFGLQGVSTYSNYVTTVKALNLTSSPTQQYGISTNAINTGTISVNNITTNISTTEQSKNLTSTSNGTLSISCNTESGGWRGMEFNGTNTVRSLAINTFSNNVHGLALDNSGIIGQQGSATSAEDNQWLGSTWGTTNTSPPFKTYVGLSSSAQNSVLYVRTSSPYSPDGNGYVSNSNYGSPTNIGDNYYHTGLSPTVMTYTAFHAVYTCAANPVPTCTNCRGAQPQMTSEDSATYVNILSSKERIVRHQMHYAVNDSSLQRYLSRMNIYRQLRGDTNNLQGSHILRQFRNQMQNSNVEKLFSIEDELAQGDFASSQSLMGSVSPANNVEQNYLTYYNALIHSKTDSVFSDSSSLYQLASGCPYTDGNSVFQARALYNALYMPYTLFKNNCGNNTNVRFAYADANTQQSSIVTSTFIYPNPLFSYDIINIGYANIEANSSLGVRINDISGKMVYESTFTSNDQKLFGIQNTFAAGTYFVNITLPNGHIDTHKLVIMPK